MKKDLYLYLKSTKFHLNPENVDLHSFPEERFKRFSVTWKALCPKTSKTRYKSDKSITNLHDKGEISSDFIHIKSKFILNNIIQINWFKFSKSNIIIRYSRLTTSCFPRNMASHWYINCWIEQQMLVMRFKPVKVIIVFSFASSPSEPDLWDLRRNHRKMCFKVPVIDLWQLLRSPVIGSYSVEGL